MASLWDVPRVHTGIGCFYVYRCRLIGDMLESHNWVNRSMTYRIMLADDQPLIRQCVRRMLEFQKDIEVVAEADDGIDLLEVLQTGSITPDLVIADVSMPHLGGIEALHQIHTLYPSIKTLILTMHNEREYLNHAMSAGAVGFVVKEDASTELLPAISCIRKGHTYVSSSLAR